MNSISEIFENSKHLLDSVDSFVSKYIGCSLLRKCGIKKIVDGVTENNEFDYADNPILRLIHSNAGTKILEKCVSAKQLLIDKIMLCFANTSAYMMFKTNTFYGDYKKDTFYRFDLIEGANWEHLQLETAKNVILDIESRTTDNHVNVLTFDDSLYSRTRGKGTDLCGKVYDHNDHKLRLGYRMMTGGWSNGDAFIPFSQALLTTRDEKLMIGPDEKVDRRTLRGKRRHRAKEKGTLVMHAMVWEARKVGIPFDYVLFDTWFSSPVQLVALEAIGADAIAMIKKNSTKYEWTDPSTGEELHLNVKEIYSRNKKRRGKSKYLLSVNVTISDKDGNSIPAKLVYARNHSNRKDWVCFVCTDTGLDEETVIRTYGIRWKTELYFRMAKSHLKLRTECHSTSYDAITAHMVIVALRYMILSVERFNNTDNRSIEELFYGIQREVINDLIDCAIVIVLDAMLASVKQYFNATDAQITEMVCGFINNLPDAWKKRFQMPEVA